MTRRVVEKHYTKHFVLIFLAPIFDSPNLKIDYIGLRDVILWFGASGMKMFAISGGVWGMTSSDFLLCCHAPLNISECCQTGIFTWIGIPSEAILVDSRLTSSVSQIVQMIWEFSFLRISPFTKLSPFSGMPTSRQEHFPCIAFTSKNPSLVRRYWRIIF